MRARHLAAGASPRYLALAAVCCLACWPAPGAGAQATPSPPDLEGEWRRQYDELALQLGQRAWFQRVADQAHRRDALILESDRDPADVVLRRTAGLLAYVRALPGAPRLDEGAARLETLQALAAAIDAKSTEARTALYREACRLRRDVAFRNPLLTFSRVLFIKRDRSRYNHMCDQFYGFNAVPGGGLFVLDGAFGAAPALRNLLADAVVERGRLKGSKLAGGGFLSPDLSFDGSSVLFAHTELGDGAPWSTGKSYHVFRVGIDGSHLRQLTDGAWNDFDPCWLPDGRVAFISERRGGFLRCGDRPCPVYTLHTMAPDGSGIRCISFHETHEWQPSVGHDGMLLYTRWDYVDRDTNAAHHPWVSTPDGCDPRALHGNYPEDRARRPWMEMDVRAVPGSPRLIATAGAHHGQAYGSFVLLDPRREDDGAMAQLRRLTPDVPFPEGENGAKDRRSCEQYATAWPLSEDVWLCAYDVGARRYGLYLADSFGNRELLYRDPGMACLSPIPVRARPKPPVVPPRSRPGARDATVAVANVYDSQVPWPAGAKVRALRVIQLLPKTTYCVDQPRIGVARQASARAVLGTVPVEADGSAHFRVPAGKPVYFQALDEHGMAIQSMRSVTYLQPGEKLTCLGCHERRHRTPPPPSSVVRMAMRRPASALRPEADGSNPLNYPRLVQGVLDRNCVGCHAGQKGVPDLRGGGKGWSPSYLSLAAKYGFYFHSTNGSLREASPRGGARTVPGQFGARASRLLAYLGPQHHGVRLPREDFRRVTLWLDCNSDYYGAYENTEAQARGEVVRPTLE